MCTVYHDKNRLLRCHHLFSNNSGNEGGVDLQTGSFGPLLHFFHPLCEKIKVGGVGVKFMPPIVSLVVSSQEAGSISWPNSMLATAGVVRSRGGQGAFANTVQGWAFKQRLGQGSQARKQK